MTDDLHALQWVLRPASIALFTELLAGLDLPASVWQHAGEPTAVLSIYLPSEAEAEQAANRIAAALPDWQELLAEPVGTPTRLRVAREDWAESWKRWFRPRRVSERVIVRPSWEVAVDQRPEDRIIQIDPGMCFGTGQHATTVSCIRFLDHLQAAGWEGAFLDAGCGSGILSIAAVKFGFSPVYAFDNDAHAVQVARENASLNGVGDEIDAEVIELGAWAAPRQWPIVAANILAEVLIEQGERVAGAVAPGPRSRLILSGILQQQFASVCERYAALGLVLLEQQHVEEWTSGLFTWQA